MSATSITIALLLADSRVAATASDRVFPVQAPQGARHPHLVVSLISEGDEQMLVGAGGYFDARVQVECLALSATEADYLGELVKAAIGDVTNRAVVGAVATVAKDDADHSDFAADRSVFRRLMDFNIRWRNA